MSNTDTGDTVGGMQPSPQLLPPRESLIATAVNFLNNTNVLRSPLQQKQKFLRSKGLSEEEIQIACERAGVFSKDPNSTVINMGITTSGGVGHGYGVVERPSMLTKIKDALSSIALISGLAYAVYLFYKKFIEPFLFGKKKKKTVEECIQKMEKKMEDQIKELNHEVIRIREDLSRSTQQDYIAQEMGSFKSDIEAIKGLLLNRKQFANPLPIVPPSIPAWQLTSQRHSETEPDKNDDAGSGSGSSETEVVTKNSDSSSLEIV